MHCEEKISLEASRCLDGVKTIRMSEPIPDEAFDGLAGRTRGGIGGRKEVCLKADLLLIVAR